VPCRAGCLPWRVTRWDVRVFARAALAALLALTLSWLVTAITDEGGVPWGERVGRTLPLTPLCTAIGVWATLAPARARGEARALEALGRTRTEVAAPAVAGGAFVAILAALAVGVLPAVSIAGFYPTAPHSTAWRWEGTAFVDPVRRLRVDSDGTPIRFSAPEPPSPRSRIPQDRAAAALATAMTGIAMAMLLGTGLLTASPRQARGERPGDRWLRHGFAFAIAAMGISAAVELVLFQAAAARKVPALLGDFPPLALLVVAARQVWTRP
jgi:hypothetical protein